MRNKVCAIVRLSTDPSSQSIYEKINHWERGRKKEKLNRGPWGQVQSLWGLVVLMGMFSCGDWGKVFPHLHHPAQTQQMSCASPQRAWPKKDKQAQTAALQLAFTGYSGDLSGTLFYALCLVCIQNKYPLTGTAGASRPVQTADHQETTRPESGAVTGTAQGLLLFFSSTYG